MVFCLSVCTRRARALQIGAQSSKPPIDGDRENNKYLKKYYTLLLSITISNHSTHKLESQNGTGKSH